MAEAGAGSGGGAGGGSPSASFAAQARSITTACPFVRRFKAVNDDGSEWEATLVPPGDSPYRGVDVRVEVSVPPSWPETTLGIRVASIIRHSQIKETGHPAGEFYGVVDDTSLATSMDLLYSMFQQPIVVDLEDSQIEEQWRNHPESCLCSNFPVPYSELGSLPEDSRRALFDNIRRNYEAGTRMRFDSIARAAAARRGTITAYVPMRTHPELFDAAAGWHTSWFHPKFLEAVGSGSGAALRGLLEEVTPGVYKFPMLSPTYCKLLMAELHGYEATSLPAPRPNSMNNYGLILNDMGMEPMMDALMATYVRPLAAELFPDDGGGTVDHHHTFLVQYKPDADVSLDMHIDDSEVTLNVSLCDTFSGAGLAFCGMYHRVDHRKHSLTYAHQVGYGVLHLGRHRHGALDITAGERVNLIMWCRSSSFRRDPKNRDLFTRSDDGEAPDKVCLSRTHDADYGRWDAELAA